MIAWLICGVLFTVLISFAVKLYLIKKSIKEIKNQLTEKLSADTNTLIGISSNDKDICSLTSDLNEQLKILRSQRICYEQGDMELKNAVTNISHDLRTPLTAIVSYLDLFENNPENAQHYIPILRERINALNQLTEELFRYSVITSPESDIATEPVVLNNILEESILNYYASLQKHGITPEINITERRIIRNINAGSLSRVFSNLLNNAVKYSDGDLEISMTDEGIITFSNSSAELSEIQVERLFDRFYTLENARKSTGLGLSIAKVLVKQMNGNITACYQKGKLKIVIVFYE